MSIGTKYHARSTWRGKSPRSFKCCLDPVGFVNPTILVHFEVAYCRPKMSLDDRPSFSVVEQPPITPNKALLKGGFRPPSCFGWPCSVGFVTLIYSRSPTASPDDDRPLATDVEWPPKSPTVSNLSKGKAMCWFGWPDLVRFVNPTYFWSCIQSRQVPAKHFGRWLSYLPISVEEALWSRLHFHIYRTLSSRDVLDDLVRLDLRI